MKPAVVNFATANNEDWQESVPLRTSDGQSVDFGDYDTLRLQLKDDEHSTVPALDLSLGDGLSVETDGALGINVEAEDMKFLLGVYVYDLIVTSVAGEQQVMRGTVTVLQGRTY